MENIRAISVFCGSRTGRDPKMADEAVRLGQLLADAGITLVYGGGNIGLMGKVARAALDAGGKVTGVIPGHLARREVMMEGLTDLHVVHSMHDRKRKMFELCDACTVLPGGIGTLDETIELVVWRQIGLHDKPILLVNIDGYWNPFDALLAHIAAEGFGSGHDGRLFTMVPSSADVIPTLQRLPTPATEAEDWPQLT